MQLPGQGQIDDFVGLYTFDGWMFPNSDSHLGKSWNMACLYTVWQKYNAISEYETEKLPKK